MELNEIEKIKIELEEKYRNEVAAKYKSKSGLIENVIKILQGLSIIAGIWATYYAYNKINDDKKMQLQEQIEQTAKEYKKGFYEKQFALYADATEVTAILATEKMGSADYNEAKKKFYRLFWGRLSIVEDKCVEAVMVQFERMLQHYENKEQWQGKIAYDCNSRFIEIETINQLALQKASLALAHDARRYILNTWLDSLERKNYNK